MIRDEGDDSEKNARNHRKRDGPKRGAAFADLVSLASLQAVVDDTRASVDQIALSAEKVLRDPQSLILMRRRVAEQEEWRRVVRNQAEEVKERCRKVSDDILVKSKQLEERRQQLARARELHQAEVAAAQALEEEVTSARSTLVQTSAPIPILRASLARTLDFIFPIQPLDPASLLFTILDCPLPVPLPSSPTPPLSLPDQPGVTEDSVASALGFVAQVVYLLAAYEGVYLPYGITCAGSRSVIRDPISEMRGPRAFPLYSRGVEQYRFEYAVYLLNKDIELLMMRRNLRALDLRHTLPNLKNLMLTLTSGKEPDHLQKRHHPSRSVDSLLDVEPLPSTTGSGSGSAPSSPSLPSITLTGTSSAPSAASVPPSSSKRPFLSPLAAMLRSRYAGGGFLRPAVAERTASGTEISPAEVALGEDVLAVPEGVGAASPLPVPEGAGEGVESLELGDGESKESSEVASSALAEEDEDGPGEELEDVEEEDEEDTLTPTAATANGKDTFLEKSLRGNGHTPLSPVREVGVEGETR
ncbi:hypothetical protein DACRYDRAFT_112777 [Dacryopinax primogenitus]|uniref:Autophagy-related protein 14 n=1 Tax=Dacryopinax primogenitus (strain DJM 731) TaxID=1858805 RepID=M5GF42_DACPD|nr:uncharacterized protein DACRYDRAFT_112777 [Dacryopinax primogenitus]EJU05952.1 hypothetical protein DACRYDRAFT_112777 [Dacryopinax primogenitus]